ncbi:MAG: mraY [Dehalococcoidia bacterium]|nr:mraY [Dehalococcoidia bacterium]
MAYSLVLAALTFVVTLVVGRPVINFLHARGIEKGAKEEEPVTSGSEADIRERFAMYRADRTTQKVGTPTMGGIIIFIPVFVITALFNVTDRLSMILPMGTIVGAGVLGGVDDMMNLNRNKGLGMAARFKMAWLLLIAVVATLALYYILLAQSIYIPFLGKYPLGFWYMPIAVLTIVATANAVNLTDGLDTLAGGTAAMAFAAYGVIAFLQEQAYLVTFCFTVVGAILGFLWYNAHPAQVFMGDAGALALGATLAVVALMTGHWLLLPVIGFIFAVEASSVIIQVVYFKITGGKRIFLMSPLHHHFELMGWTETQITMRFWLVGMLAAMVGIALALK